MRQTVILVLSLYASKNTNFGAFPKAFAPKNQETKSLFLFVKEELRTKFNLTSGPVFWEYYTFTFQKVKPKPANP